MRDMSKKQLLVLALVAAIPATGLLVKMLFSLGYLLSDQTSAKAVLWIVFVVSLLGSTFFAALPLLLWLYYPAAGFEVAAVSEGAGKAFGGNGNHGSEETAEEDEFIDEEVAEQDEGESLFDQHAFDDDSDEYDGGVDDDK
ncbi:MAG: hypothetical protein DWI22_02480 [Planctomycetota bacterium]|nr:MAG: hypothetical protein DWI22_02480 [Planctomycetota bacterium]